MSASPTRPSRGEVETLCILHVVGRQGCAEAELAPRLGLSPTLGAALVAGLQPLLDRALLIRGCGRLHLTSEGDAHLRRRLGELVPAR